MSDEGTGEEFAVQKRPWMVEIDLPTPMTMEFASLIPAQRMAVGLLMSAGVITTYMLSADRRRLWVTFAGQEESDVRSSLAKFPILPYCRYTIRELFFQEIAMAGIPRMSMN